MTGPNSTSLVTVRSALDGLGRALEHLGGYPSALLMMTSGADLDVDQRIAFRVLAEDLERSLREAQQGLAAAHQASASIEQAAEPSLPPKATSPIDLEARRASRSVARPSASPRSR